MCAVLDVGIPVERTGALATGGEREEVCCGVGAEAPREAPGEISTERRVRPGRTESLALEGCRCLERSVQLNQMDAQAHAHLQLLPLHHRIGIGEIELAQFHARMHHAICGIESVVAEIDRLVEQGITVALELVELRQDAVPRGHAEHHVQPALVLALLQPQSVLAAERCSGNAGIVVVASRRGDGRPEVHGTNRKAIGDGTGGLFHGRLQQLALRRGCGFARPALGRAAQHCHQRDTGDRMHGLIIGHRRTRPQWRTRASVTEFWLPQICDKLPPAPVVSDPRGVLLLSRLIWPNQVLIASLSPLLHQPKQALEHIVEIIGTTSPGHSRCLRRSHCRQSTPVRDSQSTQLPGLGR